MNKRDKIALLLSNIACNNLSELVRTGYIKEWKNCYVDLYIHRKDGYGVVKFFPTINVMNPIILSKYLKKT